MTSKTILIVDDEIDLREILQFDLEDRGYDTIMAEHGRAAFDIVQSHNVDLIVSVIRLPGGEGVYLLKKLREEGLETLPLIFVSGFADLTLEDAYDLGVEAMLQKPLKSKDLAVRIEKALCPQNEKWAGTFDESMPKVIDRVFTSMEEALASGNINFGRSGFFMRWERDFPRQGESLRFQITFEKEDLVFEGVCDVRWVRSNLDHVKSTGIGAEFTVLNDAGRQYIAELLSRKSVIPTIPQSAY